MTIKKENENPSVDVILCAKKDDEVVEFALSRSLSPTTVSEYKLKLTEKQLLQNKLKEYVELADVHEQIIKYEKKVYCKDTRRHTSIDAMKEYGREVVDNDADVDEVLEREELLRLDQERDGDTRREEKKQAREL